MEEQSKIGKIEDVKKEAKIRHRGENTEVLETSEKSSENILAGDEGHTRCKS